MKNKILNYQDYEEGYADVIYKFIIDNSIFYVACNNAAEGLDCIIDYLEAEGLEGWFIGANEDNGDSVVDSEGNKFYDDEYIIGGNHGRYLYHGGNLWAEELEKRG